MSKVTRAIIMAAGTGSRMRPLTETVPKPLIRVNGERMIDTIIGALIAGGISEIYVVVGYLKEAFACLEDEYKQVKLIVNPYYDTCNNISSLYVARDYISNAIILDGDQIINNPGVLRLDEEFQLSGYNCIWCDDETNEWMLTVEDGVVTSCSRNGGSNAWQLFSVSRWNEEDGAKLKKHLEAEFEVKKNTNIYWDDVAIFCYPDDYKLGVYPMENGDVIEIDTVKELAEIDKSYIGIGE